MCYGFSSVWRIIIFDKSIEGRREINGVKGLNSCTVWKCEKFKFKMTPIWNIGLDCQSK